MSRDEVPAEVRALAETVDAVARAISRHGYPVEKKGDQFAWWWHERYDHPSNTFEHKNREQDRVRARDALAVVASRASRPAAPATDAEGERLRAEAKFHAVNLEQCSLFVDSAPLARSMTDAAVFLRALARPAPAPQAVEEVRREAAEDEIRRARQDAFDECLEALSYAGVVNGCDVLRARMGALNQRERAADRQRARAGQDGGA